jgi:hypothetical protein
LFSDRYVVYELVPSGASPRSHPTSSRAAGAGQSRIRVAAGETVRS